ncbi:cobalamin biosynthesis protein CbiX [Escherichia coli]|uniref:Cobalamin biosynthesis protein CbiX n=1 Tax=Escherichia coli TaxID=562 RepID=A0A8T5ZPU5_ECOLX|nr:cobalamin biosynthesis protein CbiX [Escherichia coli]MDK6891477.1 cobalamin biosynthesis protein CbiX [Escherichia coli]MWR97825.1 cobalamin biosynthesis protein CbiX [Escherichia coli]MWS50104.1 cobalamin biosynthesis protein CbiX [Escherichia coli]MWT19686.1 cobalamin biosynthesis protein CbiX [Escherichia coli]
MTKVTTPSQLKAELESHKTYLLKACLMAFNQLRNQRIDGAFPSTYALAAQIDHLLQQGKK